MPCSRLWGSSALIEQANCHELVRKITQSVSSVNALLPPEVYHIGLEEMWPLEDFEENRQVRALKDHNNMILRWEALGQLQDHLGPSPDALIWMWGEGGMGKSVIA